MGVKVGTLAPGSSVGAVAVKKEVSVSVSVSVGVEGWFARRREQQSR